jgi:hypothetical protein
MTATLDLTAGLSDRSDKIPPARPRTCARCIHWGAQPHEKATPKWQLCLQEPIALAHADYWCPTYEGRARS